MNGRKGRAGGVLGGHGAVFGYLLTSLILLLALPTSAMVRRRNETFVGTAVVIKTHHATEASTRLLPPASSHSPSPFQW